MLALTRAFLLAAFLSGIATNFSGCSGAQNLPSSTTIAGCPAGVGSLNADCCDSSGNVLSPPPTTDTTCSTNTAPGTGAITNAMLSGSASAGSSLAENATAGSMIGLHGAMGTLGQASAATAAPNSAVLGTSTAGAPSSTQIAGSATNGSTGAGAGGALGMDPGSNIATSPESTTINPDVASNSGLGAAAVAAYSGGGALLPNGAHETGFHYGNGTTGGGVGSDLQMAFGTQRNPASSGSIDPDDYFTRIGLQDSLFKKVERRYRSTSANWAMADVSKIQVAPSAVLKK